MQSLPIIPQVCVISFLKFSLVFTNRFFAMHVALSLDLSGVHLPLSSIGSMASKKVGSKDIDRSATRVAVEEVSTCLAIYEDTKLFLDKYIKLKWQEFNEALQEIFGKNSKTVNHMWTSISPACTKLHENTQHSHSRT